MGKKRIFQCDRCIQLFSGRAAFDYHMNAHRRTDPPVKKEVAPKRAMSYTESDGNDPPILKENLT